MTENRIREALREKPNLIGLATTCALSAALLSPVPLLVGVVAEAAYLLFVPDSSWYKRILKVREGVRLLERRNAMRQSVFPTLSPDVQQRYQRLESIRAQIAEQSQDTDGMLTGLPAQLDFLVEKYLVFAAREAQFRSYLCDMSREIDETASLSTGRGGASDAATVDRVPRQSPMQSSNKAKSAQRKSVEPVAFSEQWAQQIVKKIQASYASELADIRKSFEHEQEPSTKAVLVKRAEVLQRRAEHVEKLGKILVNLNHQMALLDDSFGLINDEVRARTPEQILADIEEVVVQTNSMVNVLEEIAPYQNTVERLRVPE